MDSGCRLNFQRAHNELKLARIIFQLSTKKDMQLNIFNISDPETYYSAVISHAYYCMFYTARGYLLMKHIKTRSPGEHERVYRELENLVKKGVVDVELLQIYAKMLVRADTLLGIFSREKGKRGKFTYRKLAQANMIPAKESLDNAKTFIRHFHNLCEGS